MFKQAMIGRTLNHYRVLEKLGEGGMGIVYKARDLHLERFVALKILPPAKVTDPERRRRFVHEAKAASALNHPNIVHIYDIAECDGVQYISMEYVEGTTLDGVIARQGLKLNQLLHCSVQIADALARAHAASIIHRDLKPSNVMVTAHGQVKILDFGLAKLSEPVASSPDAPTVTARALTDEGVAIGTPGYMSPEQAQGQTIDTRSDVFSFGALLYEMATGRRPFQGDSKLSTLAAVLKNEPERAGLLRRDIPPDLDKLIARCLRKDREKRLQSMVDVKLALEDLLEEGESGRLSADARAAAPPRQQRRRLWAGAAIAVIITVAGAWFYFQRPATLAPGPALIAIPVTSYPGIERDGAISPDGKQVAFSWNGDKEDNFDIYVKLVDAGMPLRLTTHPAEESGPIWSPDGRFLAFFRYDSTPSVHIVPALRGIEKKLADLPVNIRDYRGAWSPDGRMLVISEHAALSLVSIETMVRTEMKLPAPNNAGHFHPLSPAFSPDGRWLAFFRDVTALDGIYRVGLSKDFLPTGESTRLTSDHSDIRGLVWTPDGKEIVFASGRAGASQLWRISAFGAGVASPVASAGSDAESPSIARQTGAVAFARTFTDTNIWRLDLPAPVSGPLRLIASTRADLLPQYSPDGAKIAFLSDRSGTRQVWTCNIAGELCNQITSVEAVDFRRLSWSPDGSQIAFGARTAGNTDIYAVRLSGGPARRMTTDPDPDVWPSWSRDGNWIYYCSFRSGGPELFKVSADLGGAPVLVIKGAGAAMESPDGAFIFYTRGINVPGLWKAPVAGGQAMLVVPSSHWYNWTITKTGIYFGEPSSTALKFLDLNSGAVSTITSLDRIPLMGHGLSSNDRSTVESGLSISPDGRSILYTREDQVTSDIMLLQGFR